MHTTTQIILGLLFFICSLHSRAHEGHPKHNMLLFGENEIFVSHIVYKVPHNFQVILKIHLDDKSRNIYLNEKNKHPHNQFILLLDSIDISRIIEKPEISGEIFRNGIDDKKHIILEKIILKPIDYSVVYFNELPLDLNSSKKIMLTVSDHLQTAINFRLNRKIVDGVYMTIEGVDSFGKPVQIKEHICTVWNLESSMLNKCHQEGLSQCRIVSTETLFCGYQLCVC